MEGDTRHVVEESKPLSRSLLWQLQRRFFEQHGIDAWRQAIVPHYVTSNPFIADAYARVLFGFLRDWQAGSPTPLDPSRPVYLIELGAGSGRFAFHFLQSFLRAYRHSSLGRQRVTYVMTDFAARTLDFWQTHPSLQPLVAQGLLDFAHFDAEHPCKDPVRCCTLTVALLLPRGSQESPGGDCQLCVRQHPTGLLQHPER